jgi:hypothetical protein
VGNQTSSLPTSLCGIYQARLPGMRKDLAVVGSVPPNLDFDLNDRVQIADVGKGGIVRFLGQVSFAEGTWAGIEFHNADGNSDGSKDGESYFGPVKKNHAFFVLANRCVKSKNQSVFNQNTPTKADAAKANPRSPMPRENPTNTNSASKNVLNRSPMMRTPSRNVSSPKRQDLLDTAATDTVVSMQNVISTVNNLAVRVESLEASQKEGVHILENLLNVVNGLERNSTTDVALDQIRALAIAAKAAYQR